MIMPYFFPYLSDLWILPPIFVTLQQAGDIYINEKHKTYNWE